jgi:hypothetical protein
MSTESKIRIYKTCMRPMVNYAAETRAETSKTKQLLRSAEIRVLGNIKGVTLRDRIRSDDIRAECKVIDVARRRRNWRDRVDRMGPDRWASWAKRQQTPRKQKDGLEHEGETGETV